ncbi:MAG: hypothetical protein KIH01_03765 [Candidatus Freyarchaeota archaeon]|nr:hypothetical protein [Candidatus Jordarchaeia archaeon]
MTSKKAFLLLLLFLLLLSPVYLSCVHFTGLQLVFAPENPPRSANVKNDLEAYRGEWFNLTVRVYDLSGNPAANVRVRLRDEGHNLTLIDKYSDESGYITFYWLIQKDYQLGMTTVTATPIIYNGSSWVPDPNHVTVPSSVNVKILSRTNLTAISYPETLVQGNQYYITLKLTDNLQNPMQSSVIRLYLDDLYIAAGPTNESGILTLPFIVPSSATPGTHNLIAKYSGNETHTPATLTFQVEVVSVGDPVITSVSLNKSIVKPGSYVRVTAQTSGTVSLVTLNGTSASKVGDNLWEIVFASPQEQGNYTLQLRAVGNGKEYLTNVYIYVDATPPRVTVHINNPTPKPGELVEVIVDATDETEVVMAKVNELNLYKQGNVWRGSFTAPQSEGIYTFNVTVWDEAENIALTILTFKVTSEPSAGAVTGDLEPIIATLLLLHSSDRAGETGDQLFFTGTLASCVALLVIFLKRPRDFKIVDDLASLGAPLGGGS